MNEVGSGGLGAVSYGISSDAVLLILLLIVAVILWKVGKLVWAMFAG
jgi:hypothetical protein